MCVSTRIDSPIAPPKNEGYFYFIQELKYKMRFVGLLIPELSPFPADIVLVYPMND